MEQGGLCCIRFICGCRSYVGTDRSRKTAGEDQIIRREDVSVSSLLRLWQAVSQGEQVHN